MFSRVNSAQQNTLHLRININFLCDIFENLGWQKISQGFYVQVRPHLPGILIRGLLLTHQNNEDCLENKDYLYIIYAMTLLWLVLDNYTCRYSFFKQKKYFCTYKSHSVFNSRYSSRIGLRNKIVVFLQPTHCMPFSHFILNLKMILCAIGAF